MTVLLTYFLFKHQTLSTSGELQEEIERRLQPKYYVVEPSNSQMFSHTDWPSEEFYFEVWHVEVDETRWMSWKKWLPWGRFRGQTILKYRIHGFEPSQEQFNEHHLAIQPYVQSIKKDFHDPHSIKVIYDSVNPSDISLFAKQFSLLLRDTTFRQLNPDVNLQQEFVRDEGGNIYARFFDANLNRIEN